MTNEPTMSDILEKVDSDIAQEAATLTPAPVPHGSAMLLEAAKTIRERDAKYGSPTDNFERIANRWNAHLMNRYGTQPQLTPADVAFMMIDVKLARLEQSPTHHDSIVDIAGYAACAAELAKLEE